MTENHADNRLTIAPISASIREQLEVLKKASVLYRTEEALRFAAAVTVAVDGLERRLVEVERVMHPPVTPMVSADEFNELAQRVQRLEYEFPPGEPDPFCMACGHTHSPERTCREAFEDRDAEARAAQCLTRSIKDGLDVCPRCSTLEYWETTEGGATGARPNKKCRQCGHVR